MVVPHGTWLDKLDTLFGNFAQQIKPLAGNIIHRKDMLENLIWLIMDTLCEASIHEFLKFKYQWWR